MTKLHITNELKPAKLHDFLVDKISTFPSVYAVLYLHFNALAKKGSIVDISEVAKKFNIVITDVLLALESFKERDMLFLEKEGDNIFISFSESILQKPKVETRSQGSTYTPIELEDLIEHSDELKEFYKKAQLSFDYQFTHSDYARLLTCHDTYILPLDVILTAIEYCKLQNTLNMGYLEEVCKTLHSEEAFTPNLAKNILKLSGDKYTVILETLGVKGTLKPVQEDLINKWFEEFNYPIEIILEACDKAVLNTNNPNLNYVNGILKNWYDAGVRTIPEIAEHEKSFSKNSTRKKGSAKTEKSFNNFTEKTINYSEIEKLENTYLLKE